MSMNTPTRLFDFPYYQLDNYPLQVAMSSRIEGQWKPFSTQEVVEKMNLLSKIKF